MTSELIFVGLGLSGTDGMTVKAFNALKECDKIYAEFYTSMLMHRWRSATMSSRMPWR